MQPILFLALLFASLIGADVVQSQEVSQTTESAPFVIKTNDNGILISENGKPVLQYQSKPKSKNGTHRRANYIHPLYDLDGNVLTEDFPQDHLHHRGIFWAWHQVNVGDKAAGDGWITENFDWIVTSRQSEILTPHSVRITADVQWQSSSIKNATGQPIPIVNETVLIDVYSSENNRRMIDIEIRLLAAQPDVTIGGSDDEKGYGGFSARVIQPPDIAFNTARGLVEATKNQLDCGNWVDIVGTFGHQGSKSGLAIFVHPSSAGFPQKWILRSPSKSMQNPVYPGRSPVAISQTESTVLRYRLILHRATLSVEELGLCYDEYSKLYKQ